VCGPHADGFITERVTPALKEVLKTLLDNGGRLLDAVHQAAAPEEVTATIAIELGVQDKIFWSCPP